MSQKLIEEAAHVSGQANTPMTAPAHSLTFEQVAEQLDANIEDGLTSDEAKKRLEEYGRNEFGAEKGVQPLKIFIGQIANALTLVSCPIILHPPSAGTHSRVRAGWDSF
jgi:magnesium-transporting ATPase (P-type)